MTDKRQSLDRVYRKALGTIFDADQVKKLKATYLPRFVRAFYVQAHPGCSLYEASLLKSRNHDLIDSIYVLADSLPAAKEQAKKEFWEHYGNLQALDEDGTFVTAKFVKSGKSLK